MHYSQFGYDEYSDYLAGPEWQEIRQLYFDAPFPYRCTMCHDTKKLILHKRSYAHLEPAFFRELFKKKKWKLMRKIADWKCKTCNDYCHFYDRKKTRKVELDYLFLMERERKMHWRIDRVFWRSARSIKRFFLVYRLGKR